MIAHDLKPSTDSEPRLQRTRAMVPPLAFSRLQLAAALIGEILKICEHVDFGIIALKNMITTSMTIMVPSVPLRTVQSSPIFSVIQRPYRKGTTTSKILFLLLKYRPLVTKGVL